MAFNIYTDDGVLHQDVPAVEMPANAAKTIYNKFIAENDVPAVPEGELEVTQNGTYDVTDKASVHVQVEGGEVETEEQTVTPTESAQVVAPSAGKLLSKVTVNPIPSQYIIPAGKKEIVANGDNIDVTQYATVKVAVQAAGAPTLSATYSGSSVVIGTDIETLRSDISVIIAFANGDEIALGDDEYNLTGSIAVEGSNTLTVSFGGMTAQFTVQGIVPAPVLDHLTASYTGGTVPAGTTLAQLTGITVKAVYDDYSEVTLTTAQYQLSGTLTAGQTNQVTVTGLGDYAGKTATFNVTVEAAPSPTTKATGTATETTSSFLLPNTGFATLTPDLGSGFTTEPTKITVTYKTGTTPSGYNIYSVKLERTDNGWVVTDIRNGNNAHNLKEGGSASVSWGVNYLTVAISNVYAEVTAGGSGAVRSFKGASNDSTVYEIVAEA